jgi:dCMP deaminase
MSSNKKELSIMECNFKLEVLDGRVSRRSMMLAMARIASFRGTCLRAQVGAIIEKKGRIIAHGYNGSPAGMPHCLEVGCQVEDNHCIRTIHAEMNALLFCAKQGISVDGANLYTVGWEKGICFRCEMAAQAAGIIRVFCENPYYDRTL